MAAASDGVRKDQSALNFVLHFADWGPIRKLCSWGTDRRGETGKGVNYLTVKAFWGRGPDRQKDHNARPSTQVRPTVTLLNGDVGTAVYICLQRGKNEREALWEIVNSLTKKSAQ